MEQNLDWYDIAWWVRSQSERATNTHVNNLQLFFIKVHPFVSGTIGIHRLSFSNFLSSAIGIGDVALFADTSEQGY
jgi:hypothetical protein